MKPWNPCETGGREEREIRPGLKLLLCCVLALTGVGSWALWESRTASQLRMQNELLHQEMVESRLSTAGKDTLNQASSEPAAIPKGADESRIAALQTEIEGLQKQLQEHHRLAEKERLQAQMAKAQDTRPSPVTGHSDLALAQGSRALADNLTTSGIANEKFEAMICLGHLVQISLAAERWAEEHGGYAPTNFLEMKEYLAPAILVCPSDKGKTIRGPLWMDFDPSAITYVMRGPGIEWKAGTAAFAQCPIHRSYAMSWQHRVAYPSNYNP